MRDTLSSQPQSSPYPFVQQPEDTDYDALARHVAAAAREALHPALWPQRSHVADSLRRLGRDPRQQAAQSAYHALRLFVW